MEKGRPTQSHEKAGVKNGTKKLEISTLRSIRVRIIFIAMLAIVSVSVTQIIIFGSMSRKQFKDMVISYMDDLADSYQKTMNIRVAELVEEGKQPDAAFWEKAVFE